MFKTRLLSGIVLVAILLVLIITGKDLLLVALAVISVIGMTEIYKVMNMEKSLPAIFGYAACLAFYAIIRFLDIRLSIPLFLLFLILILAVFVLSYPKYHSNQIMLVFFGLFYVGVMLSFIYQTRMLSDGAFVVWLIILSAWGCDTCAYCSGMLLGKHKLAPVLSPKKSIEGAIGGIVGAALAGFLYALCINGFAGEMPGRLWQYPLICACGAVISQIGDLAASGIKRNHEVKDYGRLIPGHGGILDRFDSVIFTAPVIYYLAVVLGM